MQALLTYLQASPAFLLFTLKELMTLFICAIWWLCSVRFPSSRVFLGLAIVYSFDSVFTVYEVYRKATSAAPIFEYYLTMSIVRLAISVAEVGAYMLLVAWLSRIPRKNVPSRA